MWSFTWHWGQDCITKSKTVSYRQKSSTRSNQSTTVEKTLLRVHSLHAIRNRAECSEPANGKGSVYFRETACWHRRASSDGATTHQWLNTRVLGRGGMKDFKDRKLCISISQFDLSTHQQPDTCSNFACMCQYKRICCGFGLGHWGDDIKRLKLFQGQMLNTSLSHLTSLLTSLLTVIFVICKYNPHHSMMKIQIRDVACEVSQVLCVVYVGGISAAGESMRQPRLIETASFFFFFEWEVEGRWGFSMFVGGRHRQEWTV